MLSWDKIIGKWKYRIIDRVLIFFVLVYFVFLKVSIGMVDNVV